MKISSAEFIKSATRPAHFPDPQFPEIAFAGRSNVGKSTLINVLLNRKNLVRTSATPGRTQLINFFNVNQRFVLVDLPGYGFAKVPIAVRKAWGPMVRTYLEIRDSLAATVFIIDIRRTPGEEDLELLDWLEEFGVPTIPVLSKIDKVSRSQRRQHVERIATATGLPVDAFSLFSALSREGIEDIRERIDLVLEQQAPAEPSVDGESR
ncbi:MAG TPA: ribosome biogenesis GTP-binding protein YihA/YsxC [Pelovirga sp.]|nr:ribosome biogenesis GTP-binding protein YihA/YsxC [Pelovirga sp.]